MVKIYPEVTYSGQTMTVGELIDALKEYDPGALVLATWEGVDAGIRRDNFELRTGRHGRLELVIDVEDYG